MSEVQHHNGNGNGHGHASTNGNVVYPPYSDTDPQGRTLDENVLPKEAMQLLLMPSRIRESPGVGPLYTALAKAQAVMINPRKNRQVAAGKISYGYMTLGAINNMIREPLTSNGFAVVQIFTTDENGSSILVTKLALGELWIETSLGLPAIGGDPKPFGSVVTYFRRYMLGAMLNIASEEDDDGNSGRVETVERELPPIADPDVNRAFNELRREAGAAETLNDAEKLLAGWATYIHKMESLRNKQPHWNELDSFMWDALLHTFGSTVATIFRSYLRMTTPEHMKLVEAKAQTAWVPTMNKLHLEYPSALRDLMVHASVQSSRIQPHTPDPDQGKPKTDAKPETKDRDLGETFDPETGEIRSTPEASQETTTAQDPDPDAMSNLELLHERTGEPVHGYGDPGLPFLNPVDYAHAVVAYWTKDCKDKGAFLARNAVGLAEARATSPEAAQILTPIARQPVGMVKVPFDEKGTVLAADYAKTLVDSLRESVWTAEDQDAWDAFNECNFHLLTPVARKSLDTALGRVKARWESKTKAAVH